ncbi:MAG TPA: sigma-70 family RNA polymerase sigma factor [Jatrophihabitans sp.]|jgi:RNA polymerase sigma-70 factor (ECF subfamily)
MSNRDVTDELVVAAARGEPAALSGLYRALAPAIRGYLRGKGIADADAVTNDVFLAVFPRLATVCGGAEGVRKLAFAIAHSRMVDHYRAHARRPAQARWSAEDDPRQEVSAEQVSVDNEATARVLAILDHLPDDQREVLVLRIIADLTVEQVAAVMGRSAGAVKQLQRRGVLRVRALVSERRVAL